MYSFMNSRSVLWLTLALVGCSGAGPDSGLKLHSGAVPSTSTSASFSFHTDACVITDCAPQVRFAVDDPEIVIAAERNQDGCLPVGWTLRVADEAVATIESAATPPDVGLCQGKGAPARVKLHARAAGQSRLEIVDDHGAVADAMLFTTDVAANVALHLAYAGPAANVTMHAGDHVEVWSTLHDAAGAELAASGSSRVWNVDGASVSVLDVTVEGHRALWPWLQADASGNATLQVAAGPLHAAIPIHVTR